MTEPNLPMEGGCRCGKVRFRVTQKPLLAMACHCTGCQHMSASAYSLSIAVPTDGFEIILGEPVIGGLHGPQSHHYHCDWCKSWVFTRIEPDMGFINVRPTLLDDAQWFAPFIETYTSEALPWAKTSARHSYEKIPEMSDYEGLVAEYQAQTSKAA